MHDKS